MKKRTLILIVLLPAAAAAWYLGSPLFLDTMVEEPLPATTEEAAAEPAVIAQGSFRGTDAFHKGEGQARLLSLPGGDSLLRLEDFSVTNGPALYVYLSTHPDPTASDDLGEDALSLGELKGNMGNQNYALPENTDLSRYRSVVIYCRPFRVVFARASLQ